jgi:hypothetical protein
LQAQSTISADVGVPTWATSSYTKWNFAVGSIDPGSELRWRGTDTVIFDAHADAVWKNFVGIVSLGGTAMEGVLVDDD